MMSVHHELIQCFVEQQLNLEVDEILSICKQGFDVFAKSLFPEVRCLLKQALEKRGKASGRSLLILQAEECGSLPAAARQKPTTRHSVIVLGERISEKGLGLVQHNVRHPDLLISNMAKAVCVILEHFRLDLYMDVFDAQKLRKLKLIVRGQGLHALVDAVVQTAYYGGYKGEENAAIAYLERAEFFFQSYEDAGLPTIESCARKFLAHAASLGANAHAFLKSALVYFLVVQQGYTTRHASQILSISRTTLQEYLKLANKLDVPTVFDDTAPKKEESEPSEEGPNAHKD
jgi:hypothetical protein